MGAQEERLALEKSKEESEKCVKNMDKWQGVKES